MEKRNRFILYIFLFVSLKFCKAQNLNLLDYNYNSYVSQINDKHWISSESGWNVIGGETEEYYKLNDTISGLKGTYIQSSIFEGENGLLWSSTYEYITVFNYQESKFTSFKLNFGDTKLESGYSILEVDTFNHTLLFRADNELYSYEYLNNKTVRLNSSIHSIELVQGFNANEIFYLGNLWLNGTGVEVFDSSWNRTLVDFKDCNFQKPLTISDIVVYDSSFWLISENSIVEFDINDPCESRIHQSPFQSSFSYAVLIEDVIVLSTEGDGVVKFDIDKFRFSRIQCIANDDLKSNRPIELYLDNDDFLWVTHRNIGLDKINIFNISNCHNIPNSIEGINNRFFLFSDTIYVYDYLKNINLIIDSVGFIQMNTSSNYIYKIINESVSPIYNKGEIVFINNFELYKSNESGQDITKLDAEYNGSIRELYEYTDSAVLYSVVGTNLYLENSKAKQTIPFTSFINDAIIVNDSLLFVGCNEGLYMQSIMSEKRSSILMDYRIHHIDTKGDFVFFTSDNGVFLFSLSDQSLIRMRY